MSVIIWTCRDFSRKQLQTLIRDSLAPSSDEDTSSWAPWCTQRLLGDPYGGPTTTGPPDLCRYTAPQTGRSGTGRRCSPVCWSPRWRRSREEGLNGGRREAAERNPTSCSPEHGAERTQRLEAGRGHLAQLDVAHRVSACAAADGRRRKQTHILHLHRLQLRPAPQQLRLHQLGVDCRSVRDGLAALLQERERQVWLTASLRSGLRHLWRAHLNQVLVSVLITGQSSFTDKLRVKELCDQKVGPRRHVSTCLEEKILLAATPSSFICQTRFKLKKGKKVRISEKHLWNRKTKTFFFFGSVWNPWESDTRKASRCHCCCCLTCSHCDVCGVFVDYLDLVGKAVSLHDALSCFCHGLKNLQHNTTSCNAKTTHKIHSTMCTIHTGRV